MQCTLTRNTLKQLVTTVKPAVNPRASLPVLAYIRLEVADGQLIASATNLEIALTARVMAYDTVTGDICAPANLLSDILASLPDGDVHLAADEKLQILTITYPGGNTELRGLPGEEFPPVAKLPDAAFTLPAAQLARLIAGVEFAASHEEARPILQGVKIEHAQGKMRMTATDGFRLAVAEADCALPISTVILPASTLREVAKHLTGESVEYATQNSQAIFAGDMWRLCGQVIDGTYPDVSVILPRSWKHCLTANRAEWLRAVTRARLMADNGVVRIQIAGGEMTIWSESQETGRTETKIVTAPEVEGALEIAFNADYLRQGLEAAGGTEVMFELNDAKSPARLTSGAFPGWQYVMMPMSVT